MNKNLNKYNTPHFINKPHVTKQYYTTIAVAHRNLIGMIDTDYLCHLNPLEYIAFIFLKNIIQSNLTLFC